jgi:serine/threonine-protein kinase
VALLKEAVGIQERVYGPVHPRVASALNELGRAAQQQGRLDEAEADFRRMADIYKTVYKDKHYLIGVALSNLAGVYKDRKRYAEAEGIFQDVLRRYADVLEPEHQMVGIAHVRYGETLLAAGRSADAERELKSGYGILTKQTSPAPVWVERARKGLAAAYDSLGRMADAERIKAEISAASKATSVAAK